MILDDPLVLKNNDRLGFTTAKDVRSSVIGQHSTSPSPGGYRDVVMSRIPPPDVKIGGEYVFRGDHVIMDHVFYFAGDVDMGKLYI